MTQALIEKQRAKYEKYPRPLLAFYCEVHGVSVRAFAEVFGISKSHAAEVMNHQKMPSLELAVRIARYFEVGTDELFAWRVDDDGSRRPLLVELPKTGKMLRLHKFNPTHGSVALVNLVEESLRTGDSLLDVPDIWKRGNEF